MPTPWERRERQESGSPTPCCTDEHPVDSRSQPYIYLVTVYQTCIASTLMLPFLLGEPSRDHTLFFCSGIREVDICFVESNVQFNQSQAGSHEVGEGPRRG